MILVHLSDLHFRKNETDGAFDYYAHLRNELLKDLTEMCEVLNEPTAAILISGDLTFAGQIEEFEFAEIWLDKLCSSCKAEFKNIFIVPGNHDVDRKIAGEPVIQSVHKEIKSHYGHALNKTLAAYLTDSAASQLLYKSLGNYNNFSTKIFCDLLPPDRTVSKRDLFLNDGSTLRLYGLNSSFVSSAFDKKEDLFIDPSAFKITKEFGVENLVICHHPYNWIRDGERLQSHLNDVAILQLFGHEHKSRIHVGRDNIIVFAGAGHPDLLEEFSEPGYNLISLNVKGVGEERVLEISVYVRVWQQDPGKFRAREDKGRDCFYQCIKLDKWEPEKSNSEHNKNTLEGMGSLKINVEQKSEITFDSGVKIMNSLRDITLKYFKLTFNARLAIAGKFNLLEEEDMDQPDFEKFRRVLLRAKDRNLLKEIDSEIEIELQKK
ncbi:metallophosphoesterase [Leptospira interrogans]|uniref:Calcineurin-like phosphoesterase family protein n=1 Tax=Leptospira interrogans str. UI 12621 TaxID=1049937 RepID=A0A0F6H7P8_LEPIR|nr:metallophosphoesterase [Leptospira interrogans]EKO24259.1 calcineurin-like phosphoesterase family protein [Leptospira interrogans str. UI 12621]